MLTFGEFRINLQTRFCGLVDFVSISGKHTVVKDSWDTTPDGSQITDLLNRVQKSHATESKITRQKSRSEGKAKVETHARRQTLESR